MSKISRALLVSILMIFLISCNSNIRNLNMEESPENIELFGEDFISTKLYERDIAISQVGAEIIYTIGDYKQHKRFLAVTTKTNGKWSSPEILKISGKYQDIEPFLAPDGDRLYFASNRPIFGKLNRDDYNIWYSDRQNGEWTEPIALDTIINTKGDEFYPSVSANNNLYFTATRADGVGREDIFKAIKQQGIYLKPEPLDSTINTKNFEFNAYISPKENLLIFSSFGRDDEFGGGDLYFSIKDDNNNWTESKNMGAMINSQALDFCPFIDWERNNFYFTSEKRAADGLDVMTIEHLKEEGNSIYNGFGNIYRINLSKLELN